MMETDSSAFASGAGVGVGTAGIDGDCSGASALGGAGSEHPASTPIVRNAIHCVLVTVRHRISMSSDVITAAARRHQLAVLKMKA